MSQPSIPDRAAMAVNRIQAARERIADVRRAGGDWTTMSLALEDVESFAQAGLNSAVAMALRIEQMADTAMRGLEDKKP